MEYLLTTVIAAILGTCTKVDSIREYGFFLQKSVAQPFKDICDCAMKKSINFVDTGPVNPFTQIIVHHLKFTKPQQIHAN